MKLITIMKSYNRAILRENAKLRSIYNTLIRESEELTDCDVSEEDAEGAEDVEECDAKDIEEETCPTCGKEIEEDDMMTAEEFFGDVADDKGGETVSEEDTEDTEGDVNEDVTAGDEPLISAKEFFANVAEGEEELDAESEEELDAESEEELDTEAEEELDEGKKDKDGCEDGKCKKECDKVNESRTSKYRKASRRLFKR